MNELPKFLLSQTDTKKLVIHTGKPFVIGEVIFNYNSVIKINPLSVYGEVSNEMRFEGLLNRMKDWYIFNHHTN